MLLAVTVLALLAAAGVLIRWAVLRVDELGRVRAFPVISTALALAVAVAAGIPVLRHHELESRLAEVASSLAGRPVSVRCETLSQAWTDAHPELGYVRFGADGQPETLATLTVGACQDLGSWLSSDKAQPVQNQVIAVHVLTHEAMHMAGLREEAKAECAAVQRDARTATLLGATETQAQALVRDYWQQVYPRLTDAYRSADCAADGSLDEGLPNPPWAAVKGP
jgi:hypothetical protein